MKRLLSAVLLALLCLTPAMAAELADVTLPDTVEVGARKLTLNGIALREKFIVDVYVAGLYLTEKSNDPQAILANEGPRMMVMHFVRDVDAKAINEAWIDGLEANVGNVTPELREKFVELTKMMTDVKKGQEMGFVYDPATGTDVMIAGRPRGGIPGKDFADAVLATWIGPKPGPGKSFKQQILGGK
ncbi:putative lipoprotein transmembrane [Pseudodesulfovibrio mercurii]|uniref:Putative lipoprotein transmembrane n=1 Tax=Pseudodesulfovibrio mercurii TaxID=641491 RepID=F0JEI0_9BACT|nr:chalcone isomerase family protein [Pseudodesulfovibrio mercurii]EGB13543.1 putative lipoprotein transmembrane [Pseudodesulfovibrio mercurii]